MKQNLEQIFSRDEIKTIQKFVAFVASDNQSNDGSFSSELDSEMDSVVRADVKEWLDRRYRAGHGRRKDS
jgi:hypothetical protein